MLSSAMSDRPPIPADKAAEALPAPAPIVREVTATAEEFARGLALAFPGKALAQGRHWLIDHKGATLEVAIEVQPPRVIAAVRLPVLMVVLRFVAGTPQQQAQMLAHMDLAMQRGGG